MTTYNRLPAEATTNSHTEKIKDERRKTPGAGDAEGFGSSIQICRLNVSTNIPAQPRTQYLNEILSQSSGVAEAVDVTNRDELAEVRARAVRRRVGVDHSVAVTLAPMIWGGGQR